MQQDKALVLGDQAQVDSARLQLSFTHVISPINGRVGLRQVDLGNGRSIYLACRGTGSPTVVLVFAARSFTPNETPDVRNAASSCGVRAIAAYSAGACPELRSKTIGRVTETSENDGVAGSD